MNLGVRVLTVLLAAAIYLGFYLFGFVMGVYSPGEVSYFTIPAAVLASLCIVLAVRSRGAATGASDDEAVREAHRLRETRGY